MNKWLSLFVKVLAFLLPLVLVVALWQSAPTAFFTSQAVQIPLELKVAINGAILALVLLGLVWIKENTKIDLTGWGTVIALEVSEFLILQLQGVIDLVPAQYDFWVSLGLYILLAVLTSLGFARMLMRGPTTLTNYRN